MYLARKEYPHPFEGAYVTIRLLTSIDVVCLLIDDDMSYIEDDRHNTINQGIVISTNPKYIDWIRKNDVTLSEGYSLCRRLESGDWYVTDDHTNKDEYLKEIRSYINQIWENVGLTDQQ